MRILLLMSKNDIIELEQSGSKKKPFLVKETALNI
jgi:hypothetical protein